MKRECKWCGDEFESSSMRQICCSSQCRDAYYKATVRNAGTEAVPPKRECKWCGTTFTPTRHDNFFCSSACGHKHKKIFRRAETADADFWAVTTPYGSHVFDNLVASWLRPAEFLGSTRIGA